MKVLAWLPPDGELRARSLSLPGNLSALLQEKGSVFPAGEDLQLKYSVMKIALQLLLFLLFCKLLILRALEIKIVSEGGLWRNVSVSLPMAGIFLCPI